MADCQIVGDQVCYKGKIWVPEGLRLQVLAAHHDAPAAGHGGQANTHALIDRSYYWPSLRRDVISYVDGCEACKRTKAFRDATAKGLHQLSVPEGPWERLACDFIVALPPSEQDGVTYENICVVTDRLTKMRRFIPMHEITARALADKFIQYVCSQFGLPQSIVTDRGKQFDSTFWKRMCEGWNCDRDMSTAFHPETDGQSENANQFLEQYLRQYCCYLQNDWVKWLPMAEFAANNHVSETTKCSPFFANYGRHPRMGTEPARSLPTGPLREKAIAADEKVQEMEEIHQHLKEQMRFAQARYEQYSAGKQPPLYRVGDKVWLNARNIETKRPSKKLDFKNLGPFEVVKAVNARAYRLRLPDTMHVHNVFHVSQLHPYKEPTIPGHQEAQAEPMPVMVDRGEGGEDEWEVEEILDSRVTKAGLKYLVKWLGFSDPTEEIWTNLLPGLDDMVLRFHRKHADKAGPPTDREYDWVAKAQLGPVQPAPAPAPAPVKPIAKVGRPPKRVADKEQIQLPVRRSTRLRTHGHED